MLQSDKANVRAIITGRDKNNPIKLSELSALSHICERTCKMIVNELRMEGERIGGSDEGYFLAISPMELMGARNIILAHIKSRQDTIKALDLTIERMKHDKAQDQLFN